jgi:hypothetical protein
MQHLSKADKLATGLRSLPETRGAFAAAQAAWRFYSNEDVTLPKLIEPIIRNAREAVASDCEQFVLAVHDWSGLNYGQHESKQDRILTYADKQLGYDLQTVLMLEDKSGRPIGPVYQGLRASDGVHSSRSEELLAVRTHLDELSLTIQHVEGMNWGKQLVHIVDAEADSVMHLRRFNSKGFAFLIRGGLARRVIFEGRDVLLKQVLESLEEQQKYHYSRKIEYKGKVADQYIAEASVVLHRLAKLHRTKLGKRYRRYVKGKPLPVRLVVSQVRDSEGNILAIWLLWTNLVGVSADTIALWYYWRWRVESYFKLLKSAGQQLEQWQQESAQTVAKRLLVAAQACMVVWALARSNAPEAESARRFLVRLSGRLMKRNKPFTEPALLAGMWVLLAMLDTLEHYSIEEIKQMAGFILPSLNRHDSG